MKPVQKKDMAYTLFCWVFAVVFAGIWLGSVVNNRTSYYQYRVLPIVVCGAAALIVLAGAWRMWRRWNFTLAPRRRLLRCGRDAGGLFLPCSLPFLS